MIISINIKVIMKITAGGVTKTGTLIDFSGL